MILKYTNGLTLENRRGSRGSHGLRPAFAHRKLERGAMIIESLVGAVILGLVATSLYGAYSFGFVTIRVSQENIRADQIMVEKLETLRVYDWAKVPSLTNNFTASYYPAGLGNNPGATGTAYSGTIIVTPASIAESYSNSLRQVKVTLNWTSGGVARNRSMSTFISQNGLASY